MSKAPSDPPATLGCLEHSQHHVLVVEDDNMVRDLAVRQLHSLGFGVIQAPDAESGFRALCERPEINLLFTDIELGQMSGIDLAAAARRLRPDLRILLTSGSISEKWIEACNLDQDVKFLAKPYRLRDLTESLRRLLVTCPLKSGPP